MPHHRIKDENKPYKTTLASEVARMIVPVFMRPGSTIIARDGTVYERRKDGSLRVITRGTGRKSKTT